MKVIDPIDTTATGTFSRASEGWYWHFDGTLKEAAIDELRFEWDLDETRADFAENPAKFKGALVEPARTNLILNNATLILQTRTVATGTVYTLSFYGTGSITLSGAAETVLVGTAATYRTTYTFTASTSSLTLTPSGNVTNAQLEAGSIATSVIRTTGSTVTRSADVVTTGVFYTSFVETEASYSGATTYGLGDVVVYGARLYESLQSGNLAHTPDVSPTWWFDSAPSNKWAMFDRQVTTQSIGASATEFVAIKLSSEADAVALMNLNCSVIGVALGDGYSTFSTVNKFNNPTSAIVQNSEFGTIVTFAATADTGFPNVGEMVTGILQSVGDTQYGLSVELVDFSKKETDEFGVTSFVERAYTKRITGQVMIEKANFNSTLDLLFSLRAQPSIWVFADDEDYSSGALGYGFIQSLTAVIDYPTHSMYSVEITTLI